MPGTYSCHADFAKAKFYDYFYTAYIGGTEIKMKKAIISIAATLLLGASALLTSCAGNTAAGTNNGGSDTNKPAASESETNSIMDEAESKLEDMSEDATHGVDDGSMGGDSSRGGDSTMFPRGK